MRLTSLQQIPKRSSGHFALCALAALLCALAGTSALGQPAQTPAQRRGATVYLEGDTLTGHTDLETVVEGRAFLRKADTVIRADRLDYYAPTDQAKATGEVRINRSGNIYEGPLLELKLDAFEGFFQQPSYHFVLNDAHGEAVRADFLDDAHTVVHEATYTTCRRLPGPSWMPDWILRAATISLDNEEDVGLAQGAYLSFKGVPILPVPEVSFPLSDRRKSGLLPMSFAVDSVNGTELDMPYYWNIAPNRDATITPRLMTNRGLDVGAEFRYLEPRYNGALRADYLPDDTLRGQDRWALGWQHNATFAPPTAGMGPITLIANINRVSDDNYWRDFTGSSAISGSIAQRLLPAEVNAAWSSGNVSGTVHVLQWQTLQDLTTPITPPYDRVPQITGHYGEINVRGFDWSIDGDFTQFEGDSRLTLQPNAQRSFALAQISRPWVAPAGYITPKLQLHATTYQFDALLADGSNAANVVVPTVSLDSGLVFERDLNLFGRGLVQTLEPRAFYVYTPYQNQSLIPNYDTALNDFNFASIYTENAFGGNDKISDNNLLTLGLSTRFIDPDSGAELARFSYAQRLRFQDQLVTLNSATAPATTGLSDFLLGASFTASRTWAFDSLVQYNPQTQNSDRVTVGARYNPTPYRVINTSYSFQRDISEQVDVSFQWPLNDFWGDRGQELGAGRGQGEGRYYAVGRMNYSIFESSMVDGLIGVEYDAGCWLGRVLVGRTQTGGATATERIMFQLEFVGFTRVGIDPLSTLTQSIPRYQNLRGPVGNTGRINNFD
jgi:LPS-assembly protein